MVGESISVTGRTHGNPSPNVDGNEYVDELSLLESELGYFTMIDAVAGERPVEGDRTMEAGRAGPGRAGRE